MIGGAYVHSCKIILFPILIHITGKVLERKTKRRMKRRTRRIKTRKEKRRRNQLVMLSPWKPLSGASLK